MFLGEIAHRYDDAGAEDLRQDGVDMKVFDEGLQQDIVNEKIKDKKEKIPGKLYFTSKIGCSKHHILI